MKIAVIGAGVSGLVAAHGLHPEHDVTVFEADTYAGGHTNTVSVQTEAASYDVDTGFIVFNDRNYPGFEGLLAELGVASQPSDMSFGVSDGADFEYAAHSPAALYANPRHLVDRTFQGMVAEYVRFNREARRLLAGTEDPSLVAWLRDGGFSETFANKLIVPQAAAVWSADPEQMWTFPARFMVEFFDNHGMLGLRARPQWRTVTGGSREYVRALVRPFADRVRLDAPVAGIERFADHVDVTLRGGEVEGFDEVVVAAHADQALAMLRDPSDAEHEVLGAIPYQANEAVLHTDRSVMPRRRRAWASWNYHLAPAGSSGPSTVTYWMNRLQSLRADRDFLVTLNRTEAIDPATIIRTIDYAHPVYTSAGRAAQRRHADVSGVNRTHYCGAYWGWGFHEDGVQSAQRVIRPVRAGARRETVIA
ncbi:MAG: NAD(P)/FAD-dependent oxidoreductase [Solirubrobacteraceae bacterium]